MDHNKLPAITIVVFTLFITNLHYSSMGAGDNVGVISGTILFIKEDFGLSAVREGIIVSAASLGALVGAAAGGLLSDGFGQRKTLL